MKEMVKLTDIMDFGSKENNDIYSRYSICKNTCRVFDSVKGEYINSYTKDGGLSATARPNGKTRKVIRITLLLLKAFYSYKIEEFYKTHGTKDFVIQYKDGNKQNNNEDNIVLITRKELHAKNREKQLKNQPRGEKAYNYRTRSNRHSRPVAMQTLEGEVIEVFMSATHAAETMSHGTNSKNISNRISLSMASYYSPKRITAYGYEWRPLENIYTSKTLSEDAKTLYRRYGYDV